MAVSADARLANHFQMQANYTLARNMDDDSNEHLLQGDRAESLRPGGRMGLLEVGVVADVVLGIGPLGREVERIQRRLPAEEMLVRVVVQIARQRVVRLHLEMIGQPVRE